MIPSATAAWTCALTSALPSFALVWPSNWGSTSLTETTAVSPSRTSSPLRFESASLRIPALRAQSLSELVSAARNPVTCVPPSTVLMLLANAKTFSVKESLYWRATSMDVAPSRFSTAIGRGWRTSLFRLRWRTNETRPPSK